MSNVTQDHPEFFKPPALQEVTPLMLAGSDAPVADVSSGHPNMDELLDEGTRVAPIEGAGALAPTSNRKTGMAIAALGGLAFAALYAAAAFGLIALRQDPQFVVASTLSFLATPIFWLTTLLFTGLFILLAVIINRGTWVNVIIGSFVVAALAYGAVLGSGLLSIHAWELTFSAAQTALWEGIAFNPIILAVPILAREIVLWLGLWITRRGKRLRDL
jgi:hypothetical protein